MSIKWGKKMIESAHIFKYSRYNKKLKKGILYEGCQENNGNSAKNWKKKKTNHASSNCESIGLWLREKGTRKFNPFAYTCRIFIPLERTETWFINLT